VIAFRKARESIVVCTKHLNKRKKYVCIPNFICAEVVVSLEVHNIPIKFYPVEFDESGTLKLSLEQIPFEEMGCCVVVNYYGKHHVANKSLIDECKKRGIGTIEDDTHVLLSMVEDMVCDFRVDSRRKILGSRYGSVVHTASNVSFGFAKKIESRSVKLQSGRVSPAISDLIYFLKQSSLLRRCFRMMSLVLGKFWATQSTSSDEDIGPIATLSLSSRYIEARQKRLRSIRPLVDLHLSKFGLLPIDGGAEDRGLVWRFWYIKTHEVALPSFTIVEGAVCCELSHWPNLPLAHAENSALLELAQKIVSVEILRLV
jgi:hypothetical protein